MNIKNENNQLIGEYDSNGNVIHEYIYLGLRPVAVKNNGNIYMIHTDYLGTPRYIMDNNSPSNLLWNWDNQDPFGTTLATGTIDFNLRFAGQYYDSESGLHYNMNRMYDPTNKRYMQSDPLGLAPDFNTYNYVSRNPLNNIDPLGLMGGGGFSASQSHYYEIHMALCENCTLADGLDAMRSFSAPNAPYAEDGAHKRILELNNPIMQIVNSCKYTIKNITLKGHDFSGDVSISINNNNGVVGVDIIGSGIGQNAAINSIVGPILFSIYSFGAYLSLHPDFGTFP